jgi:hypothetical protein
MKALLALVLAVPCFAFADNTTSLTVNPAAPIVMFADSTIDGDTVKAPWFEAEIHVNNDLKDQITLTKVELDITSMASGQAVTQGYTILDGNNIDLPAGYNLSTGDAIADQLPAGTKGSDYQAVIVVTGYIGTADHPFTDNLPMTLQ